MRSITYKRVPIGTFLILGTLVLGYCFAPSTSLHAAKSKRSATSEIPAKSPDQIVIGAYGDTRTGPYGLGDNEGQKIHQAVVENLLGTRSFDAVIFTGDAVMTNFPLWAGRYWHTFLRNTDRIVSSNIPFFPALGNHETYKWLPAFTVRTAAQMNFSLDGLSAANGKEMEDIPKAYDLGEASANAPRNNSLPSVDPNTKSGQKQIDKWVSDLQTGTPKERVEAALKLGQFEGAVQSQFYKYSGTERCDDDAGILKSAYRPQTLAADNTYGTIPSERSATYSATRSSTTPHGALP